MDVTMTRYDLLLLLDRYLDRYPDEEAMVARVRALVESRADCACRSCRPGHLTGSAWIVSPDRQRVALVHHRKLERWLQPGGHADGDTDIAAVAWREATEETGLGHLHLISGGEALIPLDIDVHVIPARYDAAGQLVEEAHEHHDLRFLFIALDDSPIVASHESHAARWFTLDELAIEIEEESILRMLRKAALWLH
jgi:8-oxo-dGTP pyrophosphatase MutT (NUDIX family)